MESRYTRIDQQYSSYIYQPSNYTYFTDQARQAGYMRPEIGLNFHEHFQHQHHDIHSYRPPSSHPYPPHPPHPHYPPHPHDMHEAIQREIEKEQIRHEIIVSEIARRTVLEAEVRRELMMERELALQRGSEGFPFGSSLGMGFGTRLPLLETRVDGSSHEERITQSTDVRERMNPIRESSGFETLPFQRGATDLRVSEVKPILEGGKGNGFETLPFQRGAADLRVSEVKPILEGGKGKEKIILLAKPGVNISGSKRKPTPHGMDACKLPSDVISNKKAKVEWSCALCHVSAHNEKGLNGHLNGKKHKSMEGMLRAQRTGKNYSIGLLPKKATKSKQVASMVNPGTEDEVKKASESLQLKSEVVEQVQNKEKYKFWCEMCKIGTESKKPMDGHEMGKKHVKRLHAKGQKDITAKNLEPGNQTKAKDEVKKASESLQFKSEVMNQVQKKKEKYKFWCEMCKVGSASKKGMDGHEMGKKHVKRLHAKGKKDITAKNIELCNETKAKDAVIGL